MNNVLKNRIMKTLFALLIGCIATFGLTAFGTAKVNANTSPLSNVTSFEMHEGASVRTKTVTGIRFKGLLSESDYTTLEGLESDGSKVSYGLLIAPKDYVDAVPLTVSTVFGAEAHYGYYVMDEDGELSQESVGGETIIVNIPYETLTANTEGQYEVRGTLTEIKDKNIAREFVGLAYIAYTPNGGETEYLMANYNGGDVANNSRSIAYIAQDLSEKSNDADFIKLMKDMYLDKVSDVDTNYTVQSYVGETLVKTESFSAKIGETVTATDAQLTGFELDQENSVVSGVAYANDKLVLKCVYNQVDTELYQVANGGFEDGKIIGWTLAGDKIGAVTNETHYWKGDELSAEGFAFGLDGEYMFSSYAITGGDEHTGTLTSSTFTVGGSGWVTFKLGGARDLNYMYVDFVDASNGTILKRAYNGNWQDQVDNQKLGCKLNAYRLDLSEFMGKEVYVRISDNATSNYGVLFFDSLNTLYFAKPSDDFADAFIVTEHVPATVYDIYNGGFDNNLAGWIKDGRIGDISSDTTYWDGAKQFEADGKFFSAYAPENEEGAYGTLRSSSFVVGGSGYITYALGGVKGGDVVYMEVMDASTSMPIARFYNDAIDGKDCTLVKYKADLSAFIGKTVYIKFTDHAFNDYGLIFCDSFKTYYANASDVPEYNVPVDASSKMYEVGNGGFEINTNLGEPCSINGWKLISGEVPGRLSALTNVDWFGDTNKEGEFFFHGFEENGGYEGRTGVLRSTNFILNANGTLSFMLGGARNSESYIRVVNALTGEELGRFNNTKTDNGTMSRYFKQFDNTEALYCYIELYDNATNNWGLLCVDSFVANQARPNDANDAGLIG
ncbi:MAG: hypothetical protein E7369_02925 [Clostridiales bacterium]|nr:hypothetical protein [Clostridiales bacterium]